MRVYERKSYQKLKKILITNNLFKPILLSKTRLLLLYNVFNFLILFVAKTLWIRWTLDEFWSLPIWRSSFNFFDFNELHIEVLEWILVILFIFKTIKLAFLLLNVVCFLIKIITKLCLHPLILKIIWDNSFNTAIRDEAHAESILVLKVFSNSFLISC